MTAYTETWVAGPHSTNFYTRTYEATSPIYVLVAVHGAAEHSGRYTRAHSSFAERGITVFSYDQRGYGRTALDAEHKSGNSTYGKTCWANQLEDLDWAVQYVHQRYTKLPIFLVGSSMAGTLCLSFVTRPGPPQRRASIALLSGIIASAPTFLLTERPSWPVYLTVKALRLLVPNMLLPMKHDPEKLSSNEETNKAYLEDPLVGAPGSMLSVYDLVNEGEQLLRIYYKDFPSQLPLLVLQGTADQLSDPAATQSFFEKLAAEQKKLVVYPGARHELHNEPVQDQLLEECVDFIRRTTNEPRGVLGDA
ncbi:Alpha/Beta hydrolase protein [Fomitopsis serialis]|uniref:Alpha/Beta hydrolase protein n=1 Tax=Fomitopsis serialis TaxID=139415 RepID=UPI0020075FF8|nr:Alpha/Beta hydrolase protein [Neoantrodia serialis]KAH9930879.1 Alpha/Beta hydrolase protein [Neoantrodia serialis]